MSIIGSIEQFFKNVDWKYVLESKWVYGLYIAASILSVLYLLSRFLEPSFSYKGKHVLITGGSSGIGLEMAKLYAKKGANVTLVARNATKLADALKIVSSVCSENQKVQIVSLDISSSFEEVQKKLAPAISAFGEVDVLINNAGTSVADEFEKIPIGDFERMYQINVLGSIYVTRVVLPGMKAKQGVCKWSKGQGARIVFVASQVAQVAIYGFTAYGASKWAIRGLAEALQMEVKPFNILVSVAYPPDTDTPGYEEEMKTKPNITKKLSESGSVFSAESVASDIVKYSGRGYFSISTGLDGWLLKQLHPGMSPINNLWEFIQPVLMAPISRIIAAFYVISWDFLCGDHARSTYREDDSTSSASKAKSQTKKKN